MGFSVLMSVYGKEKAGYLREALDSIFRQTLVPDEVVLIEDGPLSDELNELIFKYKTTYPQIVIFQFKENVQLGRALAKGVELCTNDLVARMDTDDIAMPRRFELQYQYMMNHSYVAVCGGWLEEFNDAGTYSRKKQMPEYGTQLIKYARYRNPLNHMTVMFRKQNVLAAGNYQHFPLLEDYHLWCRMLAAGDIFYNIPQVLVRMRTNEGVYERRGGKKYFVQYLKLRKEQRRLGMFGTGEYLQALVLTAGMTLQPSFVRKLLYRRVLRKL